jgi:[ribosomal protein S18]-alanine N-acetyltransferase
VPSALTAKKEALLVRAMTTDDLDAVQAIEQSVQFHPWRPAHFANCLKTGNLALVVEAPAASVPSQTSAPHAIVAYAIVAVGGREADLLNIAVTPASQRQGIASRLLEYLVAQITGRADTLFLEVRVSNSTAIHLYDKLGFNQVGVRPNYYPARSGREDALILARTLS